MHLTVWLSLPFKACGLPNLQFTLGIVETGEQQRGVRERRSILGHLKLYCDFHWSKYILSLCELKGVVHHWLFR